MFLVRVQASQPLIKKALKRGPFLLTGLCKWTKASEDEMSDRVPRPLGEAESNIKVV